MASVEIQNVRKQFGAVETIRGVSVDVPDGEFVVLVGPSGCGKSTLLRMIAGLEDISAGAIRIDGRIVNEVEPKNRDIAMVFQNYALYPHMTVAENMGFSLRLAGRSKDEISARVRDAAKILSLSDYLERHPRQLSGGQRQRVAMGRAIVRNPKVFLFDEPLSNLDAKLRVQMRAELKEVHARLRTTTVYVTHDQIEAMTMADRIVVMRDGIVEQVGKPLELYDRPVNVFVATFIGSPSMNIIEGEVSQEGDALLCAGGVRLALPVKMQASRKLLCGIRPEHLTVSRDKGNLALAVTLVEATGSETMVQGNFGSSRVGALIRERLSTNVGDVLSLECAGHNIHLFDAKTGTRVEA